MALGRIPVTRRTVLAGLSGLALSGCSRESRDSAQPKVVVVGAGLAGLAAAYELRQQGVDVRLIERSARPGGRVFTVRDHFGAGVNTELGGTELASSYSAFLGYCDAFGIAYETPQRPSARRDVLLHEADQFYSVAALRAGDVSPLAMSAAEQATVPFGLLGSFTRPVAEQIGTSDRLLHADFAHYDSMTLREFLSEQGATQSAIEFIDRTLNYNSVDTVSTLGVLRDAVRRVESKGVTSIHLESGNSSLPEAFAAALGESIHFDCALLGLENSSEQIRLRVATGSGEENWQCNQVVLAMPLSAVRDIDLSGNIPDTHRTMIDELPYTQISRTYLQTKERFWEQGSATLAVYSDGPLERFFDLSTQLDGDAGLLQCWINGIGMRSFSTLSNEARVERVIQEMTAIWPGARAAIENTLTIDWGQTYCKGAYAHFAPGQVHRFAARLSESLGRLHFAGDHTDVSLTGMEGALVSGRRAAQTVLDSI